MRAQFHGPHADRGSVRVPHHGKPDASRHSSNTQTEPMDALLQARLIQNACYGLTRRAPDMSALAGLSPGQKSGLRAMLGALIVFGTLRPDATIAALIAVTSLIFACQIALRIAAAISYLQRPPARSTDHPLDPAVCPRFTLLIPLYKEANIVEQSVRAMSRIDYPRDKLEILYLVEADDIDTIAALQRNEDTLDYQIISIPPSAPRTKPRALNYGLALATGGIITVYDAEDIPHPKQLQQVATAFLSQTDDDLAVVQAPLQPHNRQQSWIASQFELEYAIHFRVWLPFLTQHQWPIPLGGTSNHFHHGHLFRAGGWDPFNVTEDADLGFRLASLGLRAAMVSAPTYEEAPVYYGQWLPQRTRWIKGHMQTWLVLMRKPLKAIRNMGFLGFLSIQTTFAASILAAFLHGPFFLVALSYALIPGHGSGALFYVSFLLIGYLSTAFAVFALPGTRHRLLTLITTPYYWPLLTIAALRALWEMRTAPHIWAKTQHGVSVLQDNAPG